MAPHFLKYTDNVLVLMIFMFCAKVTVEWERYIPTDDTSHFTVSVHGCNRRSYAQFIAVFSMQKLVINDFF